MRGTFMVGGMCDMAGVGSWASMADEHACRWGVHGRTCRLASGQYATYWNVVLAKPCTPWPFPTTTNAIHQGVTTDRCSRVLVEAVGVSTLKPAY